MTNEPENVQTCPRARRSDGNNKRMQTKERKKVRVCASESRALASQIYAEYVNGSAAANQRTDFYGHYKTKGRTLFSLPFFFADPHRFAVQQKYESAMQIIREFLRFK